MHITTRFLQPAVLLFAIGSGGAALSDQDRRKLSGHEIKQIFSDVEDRAIVADSEGTTAVNYWYSDGRFINRWKNRTDSGEVSGTWRVHNDQRCVLIRTGLPDRIGRETCAPMYQQGDLYISVNPDGSIHGRHSLSPIHPQAN